MFRIAYRFIISLIRGQHDTNRTILVRFKQGVARYTSHAYSGIETAYSHEFLLPGVELVIDVSKIACFKTEDDDQDVPFYQVVMHGEPTHYYISVEDVNLAVMTE